MKKSIIKYFKYICFFIISLLLFLNIFTKFNKYTIIDALKSIQKINTANVNINISKILENEKINFMYKFNINKSFSNDIYKNVIATDGSMGFEVESLKLGIYTPVKTIQTKDNYEAYFYVDDVYKNLLNFENKDYIYFNYNSNSKENLKNFNNNKNILINTIENYLITNKSKFEFINGKNSSILSGVNGSLTLTLNKNDMKELNDLILKNIKDETFINLFKLDKIQNLTYEQPLLVSIDIYSNFVTSIRIKNKNLECLIDIKNINNENKIDLTHSNNSFNIFDFYEKNKENIYSIFGYSKSNDVNTNLGYFKSKYNLLVSYMSKTMEYSEIGNYDYANLMLNNIDETIGEMKQKQINEKDDSLSKTDYNNWLKLFDELRTYSYLYKESCENKEIKIDDKLKESIEKMSVLLNKLNIND